MLTPKTRKRPLRPKKASTTGAFSLELQDGDRIHFLSDTDCEVRRGDAVLGRYRHTYDDDTSDVLEKKGKADLKLVPGAENKKSEPLQAGERWITLKPQGPDSDAYVRVKIRQHPDGTASVIGGAGGKLNQLHLNKLRSPEEWKAGAAERRAKREERERKRQEAQSEDERAEEEGKVKEAREYHRNEKHQNALETLRTLDEAGIDLGLSEEHRDALAVPPSADTDPDEAKRVEALARDALKTVEKVHQAYEQKLITDHEARAAAKLGDTALDGLGNPLQQGLDHSAYSGDGGEISSITQLPNGQWLVRSPEGADQSFDDWEKAAKAHAGNVAEHDSTTGERSQEDDFYNPKLWVRQHEDLPEGFKFDVTVAGKIAALAQGRKEIDRSAKNAEKAIKKGQPWNAKKGADVQGTVIDDQAAIAALESDAKTIEDAIVHGRLLDLADILNPKELKKHLGTGGLAQLGEIASDVLKANPVDPALVQQLGHNEAAKLLAYQIRQSMSEGEYEAVVAAQGAWHGEWSTRYAQEVIDRNQPLVDRLSAIHKRMLEIESERGQVKPAEDVTLDLFGGGGDEPDPYAGDVDTDYTPDQLIELDNLAYQSRALQDTLNKDIGTALGQLQASAAMTLALESKPRSLRFAVDGDNVNVEDVPGLFSRETPDGESKPSIWAHYGLGADDFDLQDGPDGQLVSVKPSGMEKLAGASYDPADREEYERAIAIKRGEFDEENFTPDGFAYRPAQTFADVRTEAQQFDTTLNYSPEMSDDELIESMKQYIGARVANGDNPVIVHKDLLSPETYLKMGMGQTETYRAIDVLDSFDRKQFVDDDGNLLINDRRIRDFYRELGEIEAGRQRTALGTNDFQSLHTQTLDPEVAKEAAHRAFAAMPMGKAAMKPLEQLTPRERKYLREYAITEIMGEELIKNPDDNENTEQPKGGDVQSGLLSSNLSKKQERAISALRGKKDKLYIDFLTPSKNISKEDYDAEVAKVDEQIRQIEDNTLNPDEFIPKQSLPTQWQNFSKIVGGDAKAYELVRDKLKGQFLSRFSSAYGSIQGKPLLTGYQVAAHVDRLMAATLPKDEREELLAHVRSLHSSDIAKVRERNRGKFAVELDDVLEKYEKLKGADRQISLISMDSGASSGFVPRNEKERLEQEEKNKKNQKSDDKNGEWQRTILGEAAERQLDQILTEVLPGFEQLNQDSAIAIYPEVRWNGGFVAHQRGLKFLQERKKIGMHYSAGCVHGSTLLRCHKTGVEQSFYAWWLSGEQPWVLALDEPTGQTVIALASPVFVKAYDQMYRVTLESGAVITVTGGHRFLGRGGWAKLSDLAVGDEICVKQTGLVHCDFGYDFSSRSAYKPLRWWPFRWHSIRECAQSIRLLDVLRLSRKPQDSQDGCSAYSRPCDAQLHSAQGSALGCPPSLGDAPVPYRSPWRWGAKVPKPEHSRFCQSADHRSMRHLAPPPAPRVGVTESHIVSGKGGWSPHEHHNRLQFEQAFSSHTSTADQVHQGSNQAGGVALDGRNHLDYALQPPTPLAACEWSQDSPQPPSQSQWWKVDHPGTSSLSNPDRDSLPWVKIASAVKVGMHFVFDISVPKYENYLAHGIWNHNSGKSAGMLGAFTHLHSQGAVQRSIVAVPSSIVGQIVGECATFLEPGKYNYSANIGWDREKRIEALKNPDLHLHFTTRESLANDLLHLVERHTGVSPEDFQDTDARSEDDRRALMLTALKNEGIDPQGLLFSVDEAHDLSRRRGVAASKRSLALDALAYHSGHYIHATGSPLKNDVSEIADFLQKVGAPEAADMGAFMARYGKNTEANTRALQRIMAKYSYAIAVKPTKDGEDLDMRHHKLRIELTEHQKTQRQTLKGHYETIRKWKEANLKQAMAAKVERGDKTPLNGADLAHAWDDPAVREAIAALSSEGYGRLTEDEKRAKIGGQILGASAIHHTALKRLYDNAPYEQNAKAQYVVSEAKKAVAAGKPGVVFCSSKEAAKMLRDQMAKEGLRVAHADGDMGPREKDKARLAFDPGPSGEAKADVLIVTDCMQTGVNLQRGKSMWHYDVPDTQKAFEQRSARIYRRGQTENVDVVNVMADAPEDEIALARMERKAGQSEIFQGYDPTLGHAEVIDDSGLALEIARQKALMNQGGTDEQASEQMAA